MRWSRNPAFALHRQAHPHHALRVVRARPRARPRTRCTRRRCLDLCTPLISASVSNSSKMSERMPSTISAGYLRRRKPTMSACSTVHPSYTRTLVSPCAMRLTIRAGSVLNVRRWKRWRHALWSWAASRGALACLGEGEGGGEGGG